MPHRVTTPPIPTDQRWELISYPWRRREEAAAAAADYLRDAGDLNLIAKRIGALIDAREVQAHDYDSHETLREEAKATRKAIVSLTALLLDKGVLSYEDVSKALIDMVDL